MIISSAIGSVCAIIIDAIARKIKIVFMFSIVNIILELVFIALIIYLLI